MTKLNKKKQLIVGGIVAVLLLAAYHTLARSKPDIPSDLNNRITKTEDYTVPTMSGDGPKRLVAYWHDDTWNAADENTLRIAAGDAIEIAKGMKEYFPQYSQLAIFVQVGDGSTYRKLVFNDLDALARVDGEANAKRAALGMASVIN